MDYNFSSREELYKRVKPALLAREAEICRMGYLCIKSLDIWNYLIETKWKNGKDLMLADIVSDIMNVEVLELDNYVKTKITNREKAQTFDDITEII